MNRLAFLLLALAAGLGYMLWSHNPEPPQKGAPLVHVLTPPGPAAAVIDGPALESEHRKVAVPVPVRAVRPPPAPPANATTSASETQIQEWLQHEALNMDRVDPNPALTQQRLLETIHSFPQRGLEQLERKALDYRGEPNERMLSVYLLVLDKRTTVKMLATIAAQDDDTFHQELEPHSAREAQKMMVQAMALAALDEIQNRGLMGDKVESTLKRIAQHSQSPMIARTAQAIVQAQKTGRRVALEAQ